MRLLLLTVVTCLLAIAASGNIIHAKQARSEAADDGVVVKVTFSPGMPATFEYDLRTPPKGVKAAPAKVMLLRGIIKDGKTTFLSWGGQQEIKRPGILRITGLAAGTYKISARMSDKKPLANKTVKVIPLGRYGFDSSLYYPASITDSNGKFEFVGIRPNSLVYVSSEKTSISLGKKSLTENASVSADIVLGLKKLPIVIGKPVEEIAIDWKEGKTGRLWDLKGKIVVLDVWSTSCAPCIRALPEFNSLAAEFPSDSDFVFVALSIDYDNAVWEKMVDESEWNAFKHGRLDRKKNSFFFSRPIPYSMIIDKNGVLRAEDNGLDIGLELDKLAKTSDPPGDETPGRSTQN